MSGPVDDGGELELGAHLRPGGPVMTARPRATEVSNLKKHRRSARIDARRADKMKKAKVLGTVRRTFEKETLELRELEAEHKELERQVAEWKAKCEAIEKRESERRAIEEKKHSEEVQYLKDHNKKLKNQLNSFLAPGSK